MLSAPETRNRPFRCCTQNPATIPELVKDERITPRQQAIIDECCAELVARLDREFAIIRFSDKGAGI